MSEHWPPEWDDQDDTGLDDEAETGQPDAGHLYPEDSLLAGQLAEITSALASVPRPALPDAFEARISAAIAAEAATRTEHTGAAGGSATARSLSPDGSFPAAADGGTTTAPPARSRRAAARRAGTARASGPPGTRPPRRGFRRLGSPRALGSLAACLLVAGFGYLIVHAPSSSSYSSAESGAVAGRAYPASSSAASAFGGAAGSAANVPQGDAQARAGQSSSFTVSETGTRYEPATLAGQVQTALAATDSSSAAAASSPGPSSAEASASAAPAPTPSAALAGCVKILTRGATPSLVDRATYAGRQAYIIAVPGRAWVVGLGCTAAKPQLITTIALAG